MTATDVGFEVGFRQLEQTVGTLEGGDLGLDAALTTYEQGVRLLRYLYGLLDGAERTVALLREDGTPDPEPAAPFDTSATAGIAPAEAPNGDLDDLPF